MQNAKTRPQTFNAKVKAKIKGILYIIIIIIIIIIITILIIIIIIIFVKNRWLTRFDKPRGVVIKGPGLLRLGRMALPGLQ